MASQKELRATITANEATVRFLEDCAVDLASGEDPQQVAIRLMRVAEKMRDVTARLQELVE